jgi:D-tyrosyl-tRNA(Tyr) deacylase
VRVLLQRVERAAVTVDGVVTGAIETGLVALVGITHTDTAAQVQTMARKVHELRILRGERSIADGAGAILVISQFTLYADTRKGRRPSWLKAAPGGVAEPLVELFVQELRARGAEVATGLFGADMRVELVNDGPTTVLLEV